MPEPGDIRVTSTDGTATTTLVEVMQDDGSWRRLHGVISVDIDTIRAGSLVEVGLKAYASGGLSLVGRHSSRPVIEPCPCGFPPEAA